MHCAVYAARDSALPDDIGVALRVEDHLLALAPTAGFFMIGPQRGTDHRFESVVEDDDTDKNDKASH
jgi:hypothetical protein